MVLGLGGYVATLSAAENDAWAARYSGLATFFSVEDEANRQQAIEAEAARYTGLADSYVTQNEANRQRVIDAEAARYTGLADFFTTTK